MHITAAAAWVGGATMLELTFNPKIGSISRIQGALLSRRVESLFQSVAWIALATMSITGIIMAVMQDSLNFQYLIELPGLFLLACFILTGVAITNGLLITFYFMPRLSLIKYAETNLRRLVIVAVRLNNSLGIVIVILMVVFTELALPV